MSKKKIIIAGCTLLLLVGIGVFLILFFQGRQVDKPVDNGGKEEVIRTQESDIDVSDYEEYNWRDTAGEVEKDEEELDRPVSGVSGSENDKNAAGSTNRGVGLALDESKNSGIEVDFDSWAQD